MKRGNPHLLQPQAWPLTLLAEARVEGTAPRTGQSSGWQIDDRRKQNLAYLLQAPSPSMTDAAPPPGMTRAEFYTGRYAIRGDVFTGNDRRLVDALRDSTRQYLEIKRHIGRGKPHGRTALQRAAQ